MTGKKKTPKSKGIIYVLFLSLIMTSTSAFGQTGEGLFHFSEDVRLFTAYAMMNASGNRGEWRTGGMDPIRIQLRADLSGRIDSTFRAKIRAFNQRHGQILETYEAALLTSGPPDFHWSYNPKKTGDIAEIVSTDSALPNLLAEFYRKARVAQLWDEYRPLIQAENDKYKPFADKAMDDVLSYCRLDSNFFYSDSRLIHFEYMPLLPYFTSMTAWVNGQVYFIVGPQENKPDQSIFYYLLLNRVTFPLVKSDSTNVQRLAGLFDAVKSKIDMRDANWRRLVAECFSEAMDIRLQKRLYALDDSTVQASLATEYKYGFILCPTIYRDLRQYESSGVSFSEYLPKILKSIDYNQEIRKWNDFWAKQ